MCQIRHLWPLPRVFHELLKAPVLLEMRSSSWWLLLSVTLWAPVRADSAPACPVLVDTVQALVDAAAAAKAKQQFSVASKCLEEALSRVSCCCMDCCISRGCFNRSGILTLSRGLHCIMRLDSTSLRTLLMARRLLSTVSRGQLLCSLPFLTHILMLRRVEQHKGSTQRRRAG